ncbi:MAG: aminopeptidase [Candidatus Altimarinota bacterium]
MNKHLERIRKQLLELRDQHLPLKAAIDLLLQDYADALQPPLSKQMNFVHKAQRLIKLAVTRAYENKELMRKILNAPDPSWLQMKSLPVEKELIVNLAHQLFQSSGARTGDKIVIATTEEGKDVTEEVIRHCLLNGVDFELGIKDPMRGVYMINDLDEAGLRQLSDLNLQKYEGVHREIIISSSSDIETKKLIDEKKNKLYRKMNQEIHDRAMAGELHYTLTRIPTPHDAQLDGMSYESYLELFFQLCDQPWEAIKTAQQKLIERFDAAAEVHITNEDGTDVTLDITGQTFANSVIAKNIPGSEIFSSPLRNGTNGVIVAKGKFQYGSSEIIEDVTMKFESGRLVEFSAKVGQKDLEEIITADDEHGEGTRHLGELGIGTNPHLRRHVVNGLLVEKIGGSFHVALGSCYTYQHYLGSPVKLDNGNRSFSGTHWDLTTMLRGKNGKMFLDGKLIQENGDWIGEEYRVLNEGWGAVEESLQPAWWKHSFPKGY